MKFELKEHLGPSAQQFCIDVLIEKYAAFPGEVSVDQIRQRVATIGKDPAQRERFLRTQREGFAAGGWSWSELVSDVIASDTFAAAGEAP